MALKFLLGWQEVRLLGTDGSEWRRAEGAVHGLFRLGQASILLRLQ